MTDWQQWSLVERFQRELAMKRIRDEIAPYLVQSRDRFFGSLIVLVYSPFVFEFEPLSTFNGHVPAAYSDAAKRMGFPDARIADLIKCDEDEVRARRKAEGVIPVYKRVDTCSAEFESYTPYLYSTYESECEADPSDRKKIMNTTDQNGPIQLYEQFMLEQVLKVQSAETVDIALQTDHWKATGRGDSAAVFEDFKYRIKVDHPAMTETLRVTFDSANPAIAKAGSVCGAGGGGSLACGSRGSA